MAITVKSAKELVNETGALNMVVYGPPGIGKTTFASTAPKPLIIDLEGGFLSIAGKDVDVCRAHTLKDVREAIRHAIDNKYGTVVIDSLTRLAEMHMKEIVGGDGRPQIHHWGMLVNRFMWCSSAWSARTRMKIPFSSALTFPVSSALRFLLSLTKWPT